LKIYSDNGAARELGVSHTTVLRWYHAGRFPSATRDGRTIHIASRDIHGPRVDAQAGSADQRRPTLHRPYRALVSVIILPALEGRQNPARRAEAQAWLDSPMCHLMLETLGMDPEKLPAATGAHERGNRGSWAGRRGRSRAAQTQPRMNSGPGAARPVKTGWWWLGGEGRAGRAGHSAVQPSTGQPSAAQHTARKPSRAWCGQPC
jgi:hypothetical protein